MYYCVVVNGIRINRNRGSASRVWAIIIGIIIAGKFIYRWEPTKKSAKYVEQRNRSSNRIKEAVKGGRMTGHKYDPQIFSPTRFRDYLRMSKKEK